MQTIDEIIANKIMVATNFLLMKKIKPDLLIDKVTSLKLEEIKKMKKHFGIEGVILDVDDTLRKNMKSIPEATEKWIEMIKKELKVIVVTNGIDKNIKDFFALKGIDYIGFARKPFKKNFRIACEKMNLTPEKVLVIGDSLISDIWGGKRNKMHTALVDRVDD